VTAQPKLYITEEMYLQRERTSLEKCEYYNGDVYAMAGASEQHNIIAMNLAALLHAHLRGRSCRAYPSDMRVKVLKTGLHTYPDFTITCGQSLFSDPEKRDTLINPVVIMEILSPSTERYDRGVKFQHYRTIDTLQEYILIAQDRHHVERFTRQENNEWLLSETIGIEGVAPVASIQALLQLHDIYEQVVLAPEIVIMRPHDRDDHI